MHPRCANLILGVAIVAKLEVFFDCSSPWTYLAIAEIGDLARRTGAQLIWRPILVGGIFNQVNQQVYENRAKPDIPKYQYMLKDLSDWSRHRGVTINWPTVFPVNAVKAQRACIAALDDDKIEDFALAICAAYWGDDVDIEPFPLPGLLMPTEHVVAFGAALAGRPNATKLQIASLTDFLPSISPLPSLVVTDINGHVRQGVKECNQP